MVYNIDNVSFSFAKTTGHSELHWLHQSDAIMMLTSLKKKKKKKEKKKKEKKERSLVPSAGR